MSIQRVSDLPPLIRGTEEYKNENLSVSWFELSYRGDYDRSEMTQRYDSRKIMFSDCLCSMAQMIDLKSKLSGDVYINEGLSALPADQWDYNIELFANNIKLHSPNPVDVSSMVLQQLSVTDSTYGGKLPDNPTDNDDWNQLDDNQSINFGTLKKYIKFCLDNSGQSVPYLTYIFSDHVVDNDCWLLGGSRVNLQDYPDLSVQFYAGGLSSRLRFNSSSSEMDEWFYKLENNTLTLPKSNCYLKVTSDPSSVGNFISAQAPNITGTIKSSDTTGPEPLTFCDRQSSSGALKLDSKVTSSSRYGAKQTGGSAFTRLVFNANNSNPIYNPSATTIRPDSNNMLVYFYVGRKASNN